MIDVLKTNRVFNEFYAFCGIFIENCLLFKTDYVVKIKNRVSFDCYLHNMRGVVRKYLNKILIGYYVT